MSAAYQPPFTLTSAMLAPLLVEAGQNTGEQVADILLICVTQRRSKADVLKAADSANAYSEYKRHGLSIGIAA